MFELIEFIIGVFLQLLGLPFVAVSQVSLFSKVTAEKTQGEKQREYNKRHKKKINETLSKHATLTFVRVTFCHC